VGAGATVTLVALTSTVDYGARLNPHVAVDAQFALDVTFDS
jgi:hypothetical protein